MYSAVVWVYSLLVSGNTHPSSYLHKLYHCLASQIRKDTCGPEVTKRGSEQGYINPLYRIGDFMVPKYQRLWESLPRPLVYLEREREIVFVCVSERERDSYI